MALSRRCKPYRSRAIEKAEYWTYINLIRTTLARNLPSNIKAKNVRGENKFNEGVISGSEITLGAIRATLGDEKYT